MKKSPLGSTPIITKSKPPGSVPGLSLSGETIEADVRVLKFSKDSILEECVSSIGNVDLNQGSNEILWLDIVGSKDRALFEQLRLKYNLHKLALEDVVDGSQRAKVEFYDQSVFIIMNMITNPADPVVEQLCVFVLPNAVITVQERAGDCLEPIRNRLRLAKGSIRKYGSSYLAYSIIDSVVDVFFPTLEHFGNRLNEFEEVLLGPSGHVSVNSIHELKKELLTLKGIIWGHRDFLKNFIAEDLELVDEISKTHMKDAYDHTLHQLELVEAYRDIGSHLMDLYFAKADHQSNEVMKFLTVIAAIFIPLTFIAGVYGMNFEGSVSAYNMPELRWAYGYPAVIGLMAFIAVLALLYFRKKKWL